MTEVSDTHDKKAHICAAVDLGWRIVEMYHWSNELDARETPAVGTRLPGFADLSQLIQAKLLSQQIEHNVKNLISPAEDSPLAKALSAVSSYLGDTPTPALAGLHERTKTLHRQILEAVNVQDFTLAKAYSLGQTLADTASIPTTSDADTTKGQFQEQLQGYPIISIYSWLVELKSLLPNHPSYAVNRTLEDWRTWAAESKAPAAEFVREAAKLHDQARVWRQLLTGEKLATDLLNVGHYAQAAREIFIRVMASAGRFWKTIALIVAIVAAVVLESLSCPVSPCLANISRASFGWPEC
jgi:hypothetical protein